MPTKVARTPVSGGFEVPQANKAASNPVEAYEALRKFTLFFPAYLYALKCHQILIKNLGVAMGPPNFKCFDDSCTYTSRRKSAEVSVNVWASIEGWSNSETWELDVNKKITNAENFEEILDSIEVEFDDEALRFMTDEGLSGLKKELGVAFAPFKVTFKAYKLDAIGVLPFKMTGEGTFKDVSLKASMAYNFRNANWEVDLEFNTDDIGFIAYLEEVSMIRPGSHVNTNIIKVSFKVPPEYLVDFIEETCFYFKP
jgi:hypothetical protein